MRPKVAEMSSSPSKNKRPAPELTIDKTAYVHESARLYGRVTIGANTFVHPNAVILALGGPIEIGGEKRGET